MKDPLTPTELVAILERIGLQPLVASVEENEVSGEDLALLTDDELKEELGWTDEQITAVRDEISRLESESSTDNTPEPEPTDFSSPFIPHPSDDFRQVQFVFISCRAALLSSLPKRARPFVSSWSRNSRMLWLCPE